MAPMKQSLSSSGKVKYAVTNQVAFLDKESVHPDFHPLMDFLKNSPVSYALTATPTIYAEIVQEMWSTACSSDGQIKLKIKGKSYTVTPSLINKALHLPNSNFQSLPTDEDIISMLKFIKYASKCCNLCKISRKYLCKEWSYFFDTLSKVFGYVDITKFVLQIAYSLIYGRKVNIGSLLFEKLFGKLGRRGNRSRIIHYARFLMIIANHLCKELSIEDRDDTLKLCVQTVSSFCYFEKFFNAEVEFVLPDHIQAQLSTLSPSYSHTNSSKEKVGSDPIPSTNVTGLLDVDPKKKMEVSAVKPETGLLDVDPEMPPGFSRGGVLVVELPSSPEEDIPKDQNNLVNQHLVNTASIIKSQLVACLTSFVDKLSHNDMINLANRSYNALRVFGDDYTSFRREVDKLIAHRQVLEYAAKNKEKNDQDISACYIQQKMSLSDTVNKFVGAQEKLSTAETNLESLKLKREELTGVLLKLSEELCEEEKRVKTLAAERNQWKEACSNVEAELIKLDAEKVAARVAFEAINNQYSAAKDEFERMNYQLLQLVRKF